MQQLKRDHKHCQGSLLLLIFGWKVYSDCSVLGLSISRSWIGTLFWFLTIRTLFLLISGLNVQPSFSFCYFCFTFSSRSFYSLDFQAIMSWKQVLMSRQAYGWIFACFLYSSTNFSYSSSQWAFLLSVKVSIFFFLSCKMCSNLSQMGRQEVYSAICFDFWLISGFAFIPWYFFSYSIFRFISRSFSFLRWQSSKRFKQSEVPVGEWKVANYFFELEIFFKAVSNLCDSSLYLFSSYSSSPSQLLSPSPCSSSPQSSFLFLFNC